MNYGIQSKHTRGYFCFIERHTDTIVWSADIKKAAKFEDQGAARAAAKAIGFGEDSIRDHLSVVPIPDGHMRNPTPMRTLDAPRKVTTAIRQLSPETLAECRRVGGAT